MSNSIISKIFISIILLVLIEIIVITQISSNITKSNLHEETVDYAKKTIKQYKEIREYYNDKVVSKITENSNINIDSKHKNIPNTIPLPATMFHDISENISKKLNGMKIKLYSDYPFPNRANRSLDDFERSTIQRFRNNKSREPIVLQDTENGINVIRLAIADEMTSMTCVNCHNTRVDTPKDDWKLGDVRGVLEVVIPIEKQINNAEDIRDYISITIFISSIILLIMIYYIIFYFSKIERKDKLELLDKQNKLNKSLTLFSKNVIASSTDTRGFITSASKALCDISGYKEEELIGKPHNILRHPDMKSETFHNLWKTIKEGKIWDGEIKNKKKNGTHYWVRTTIIPELDVNSELIGYRSIRHDITAQKAKEEFMSNMSHELRTPLNAIIGFVGILSSKLNNKKHKEYLGHIKTNSMQLLNLINDILDLSKIKSGDFSINKFESNAYDEINTSISHFDGLSSNKELIFKHNISKDLQGIFVADWFRITQIISNLISNSVKFTPEGGKITLDVSYSDESIVIIIADNGIGMNSEVQNKIFKPFVQADGSTTREYGGTGLGLSITQNLINLMDGRLHLVSEEGSGSKFTVIIPIEKKSSTIKVDEKTISNKGVDIELSGKILVAEDNKTNQLLIKLLLEDLGVECDIAEDGLMALEMYDPSVHELILMDENMPNMNGITAMRKIKDKYKDDCGPIIALTANVMQGDKERFLKEGMDSYLPKPIDETELLKLLRKFLKNN